MGFLEGVALFLAILSLPKTVLQFAWKAFSSPQDKVLVLPGLQWVKMGILGLLVRRFSLKIRQFLGVQV